MPNALVGDLVRYTFGVDAADGTLYTTEIGGFVTSLYRRSTGAYVNAPEPVTVTFNGGVYDATFTPGDDSDGYVYLLTIVDPDNPAIHRRSHVESWSVSGVSKVVSESDSFCSISDVQALVQRGPFTATGSPTRNQVLLFMSLVAEEIESAMSLAGAPYTVPSGAKPIDSSAEPGKTVASLARQANMLKAAYRTMTAQALLINKEPPDRAEKLHEDYKDVLGKLSDFIAKSAGVSGGRARVSFNPDAQTKQW